MNAKYSIVFVASLLAALVLIAAAGRQGAPALPDAQARLEAAAKVCQLLHDENDGAPRTHEGVEHTYIWSKRWMEAQRDVEMSKDGGVAAAEAHLQRMREFDQRIQKLHEQGAVPLFYAASTRYFVVEGEELLARAKSR